MTLILAGFIKVYLYFKYFKVNIIDYVELSEVINLFMDNILAFLCLFLYSLINIYLLYPSNLTEDNPTTTIGLMFPCICSGYLYYIGLIIISVSLLLFYLKRKHIYIHEFILIILSIWVIIPFFISKIIMHALKTPNSDIITIILVFVSFCLMGYIILACYNEIYKVVYKKFYSNYSFKIKENQSQKNIDIIYIGKTKGFYFFFNTKTKDVTIYPSSEIKEISINQVKE